MMEQKELLQLSFNQLVSDDLMQNVFGVILLTARPIDQYDIIGTTWAQLENCAPKLFEFIRSDQNCRGLAGKDPEGRYCCARWRR